MSIRNKILTKINKIVNKYQVYHGQVYKRFIVSTGGDSLIGKPGTVSKSDIEIYPRPVVFFPKYQGISQNNKPYVVGNTQAQIGDIILFLTYDAITEDELDSSELCFVFKYNDDFEEEFYIIASDRNIHIEGQPVGYMLLLRSRIRK